jgi:hypothetical protein
MDQIGQFREVDLLLTKELIIMLINKDELSIYLLLRILPFLICHHSL